MGDNKFRTAGHIDALPSAPADHRFEYGAESSQFVELRLPDTAEPFPTIFLVHGGCWVCEFASLQNTRALAEALRREGYATINAEYRRADEPGGGWPGTFLDIAAAIDCCRIIAGDIGLDLGRVAAMGHSAGGHLALWASARHRLAPGSELYAADPLPVRGAIILGGPGDIIAGKDQLATGCGVDGIGLLMGGEPGEVRERYAQGSPAELLPLSRTQIFITGSEDPVAPPELAEAYRGRADIAGEDVETIIVEGAAHHECCDPGSLIWPHILNAVRKILD